MARIRDEWDKLIELFAEVAIPRSFNVSNSNNNNVNNDSSSLEPWILQTYPKDYSDKKVLSSVPIFAHPCSFKCDVITHFSFVLTNLKSEWTFGYCRHTPDSDTCLVILSDLPWHSTFYKILDHCAELATRKSSIPLERFLEALYTSEIPQPGLQLVVTYTVEDIKLKEFNAPCPDHQKLPCIPEDRNITEYYNAISPSNMIAIFASMLNERRIVMTSEKLNRLSACVQAANQLIYPMHWQHIFIPLLPAYLDYPDYLTAPMPFLIGVPQETFNKRVTVSELGEIVILNVDTNQLSTPFDDVSTIPSDVLHHLRKSFKNPPGLLGDGLCRAFLRALVMLIGGYREALTFNEKISFDRDAFVSNVRGTSRQLFLERMLQLQTFQQFIESRLDMLNRGERFVDEFEIELNHMEQSANSRFKTQYREWTATMRKEGGALLRAVNPKVKFAISRGRQAFRQVRQRITAPNYINNHITGTTTASGEVVMTDRPSSEPSSPKLPPIIKKSISGNFTPTPTSRTVTYVRNPQYLSSSSSTSSNKTNGLSRTITNQINSNHLQVLKNGSRIAVAPSASSESSDIDDNDFAFTASSSSSTNGHNQNHRSEMNFQEELESIFQGKINQHRSSSFGQRISLGVSKTDDQNDHRLPIPPPRTINNNNNNHNNSNNNGNHHRPKPPTINLLGTEDEQSSQNNNLNSRKQNNSIGQQKCNVSQCLIEFDSPPRDLPSSQQHRNQSSMLMNATSMFDPLLICNNSNNSIIDLTPESPPMGSIHTLHVSNSNFYVTDPNSPPIVTSSTIPMSNNNNNTNNTTTNNNPNNPNSFNPFGWQMFD